MPTPFDYDRDPQRFGVDAAVAVNVLDHLADPSAAVAEAHRVLAHGGVFLAAAASRHDSPELAHVWRPRPWPSPSGGC